MTTFDPLSAPGDSPGLEELRAGCPVTRTPAGPWYLARYADVLAATQNVQLFEASFREPGIVVPDEEQLINEIPEPRHGQVRKTINSAIAVHRLVNIEPFCERLCHGLLDDLLARPGPVEMVHEFVMPVPNNVIAHLLGAPPADFARWAAWSDEVVQGTWPATNRNERGVGLPGAHPEFTDYVDALIAARRDDPRDDFITRLLESEVDGRRLTDVEARTQLVFLFISGNETTRHLIGNLLWTVAHDADLYEQLRADRELVAVAVEESLRHDPPIRFLLRNCMEQRELHGEQLSPGDKVAFGILSANRDESVFDDPHAFRLDRPDPRAHVAFGGGPHVCPGASLARLEARVALSVVLDRVATIRPEHPGTYDEVPVAWAHGPRALEVRLTATT
ncbi:MAG TPA: cytochrome P450 [Acidimicrobiia bacterium]|jgi:cytochrome P450|nr:cytochrome P450 [Acidimicrobiia bacterium]